jgi:hypothetical protein
VLLTGLLLPVSGLVLLIGRRYLVADLAAKPYLVENRSVR